MSTYTQILYQIVFSTKNRRNTLVKTHRDDLYWDIWGILKNKNCHLYRINGVENHLHILTHVHPTTSLSNLIKDIKLGSSDFIKKQQSFPNFKGWQQGYAAFTYTITEKKRLITYIKNQQNHHETVTYKEELIGLLNEHNIAFKEKYLL